MKQLSIVIPAYFEEEVIEQCYVQLKAVAEQTSYGYELIFINDGSKDRTMEILLQIAKQDNTVKIIDFARNFGHQAAVSAGINRACGDAIVIIDADLQDPPEVIHQMLSKWEEGYDIVYGKRKRREGETWFKLLTAKYFYKFLHYMSDVDIPRDTGDFRLIDRKVAYVFNRMSEKNRFIRGMISWVGFKQSYVEYDRHERFAGVTKYPFKKMIKFASDGIVSFSSKPLRYIMKMGFFAVLLAFVVLVYSVCAKILGFPTEAGWTSIMVAITLFSGVQLLSLGIIGEYIARIYDESKDRPLYIVQEEVNFVSGQPHYEEEYPLPTAPAPIKVANR
ncbi:glycosyltransferase family 2 protein [Paenibacillus sp. ACRRX]|uniref:glycosyltransferase family 2 protein n=1 Tax=unclassified Paenibacillus TaxID=185978 RepID=UPI001EF6AA5B|nr:glycosyltransferase family 2 protein [Paenibacillus sp. UMB4589-SE434]MCG7406855.1 glycosyltransferase family 2 protein [Paenibacillus sp. ACRRX]MDK8179788.1 glycosyltransferase family 2 protein [Paenibacillus sp. UMB4589-SE434]